MKTLQTVGDITVDYVECTYTMLDILSNLVDSTDNLIEKAIYKSMDADKIYIENNSQGYYEGSCSDHSVSKIDNLVELIPLIIKDNNEMLVIWNNGIDKYGETFTSPYIEDLYNCFDNSDLHNFIEEYVDKITDNLIDKIIDAVRNRDESDYQDAHNFQSFATFMDVNNIEDDHANFYDYEYVNRDKGYGTHEDLVAKGYTQITHDQYNDLYVKLPKLVEHERETFDDGVLVRTETFYTFA